MIGFSEFSISFYKQFVESQTSEMHNISMYYRGKSMDDGDERIHRSEEIFEERLALKRERARISREKAQVELDKQEMESVRSSVEYLKVLYEKTHMNEKVQEDKNQSHLSLKAHLYASKYEANQLKEKLEKLNYVLSSSPYVYCLVNMEFMTFEWLSNNVERLFGYSSRNLKGVKVQDLLLDTQEPLEIKDGFILNQPLKKIDKVLTWVDLHFQMSTKDELTLITFHEVKERYKTL